jgi:hypothetical protein
MIIVSGTKRSGTSMWMQILTAAGFPFLGEAFPRNWGSTIKAANPGGFYESILRRGIYYRTNPHPVTGRYFLPEQVEGYVGKVFIPGLVRTERAYIEAVIASIRHWREYDRSIRRLYAMEDEAKRAANKDEPPPVHMPPILEWWHENYMLLRDVAIRQYRAHLQSYDGLLADPAGIIERALKWLGRGDLEAAVAAVKPEHRTQKRDDEAGEHADVDLDPNITATFDLLYDTIDQRQPPTPALIAKLNDTHKALEPRIREARARVAEDARRRKLSGAAPATDDLDD